jgi:hypothetical protein
MISVEGGQVHTRALWAAGQTLQKSRGGGRPSGDLEQGRPS